VKCLFTGRANFSNWVVITTFIIFRGLLIYSGLTSSFDFYNYIMTNPQKGIWSLYNSQHDQSTMGIDPMNNISNNNKNTLCSYIILTLPLNKKGILQHHHARERGQHHQQHQVGERTASSISSWNTDISINHRKFSSSAIVILKRMQSSYINMY
jgi:hypothetical protein